jgi:hypothetical protein
LGYLEGLEVIPGAGWRMSEVIEDGIKMSRFGAAWCLTILEDEFLVWSGVITFGSWKSPTVVFFSFRITGPTCPTLHDDGLLLAVCTIYGVSVCVDKLVDSGSASQLMSFVLRILCREGCGLLPMRAVPEQVW